MIGNLSLSIALTIFSGVLAVGGLNSESPKNVVPNFPSWDYASNTNLLSGETLAHGTLYGNFWLEFDCSTDNAESLTNLYRNDSVVESYNDLSFDEMVDEFKSFDDSVALITCDTGITGTGNNRVITYTFNIIWKTYRFNVDGNTWPFNDSFGFLMDTDLLNTDDPDSYIIDYYMEFGLGNRIDLEYNFEYLYSPRNFIDYNTGSGANRYFNFNVVVSLPYPDASMGFYWFICCSDATQKASVYNNGYNDGFIDGNQVGYNDGYRDGYDTGYSDGRYISDNANFFSLFDSIADTPLRFIYGLFNFNLFGTSVLVVVLSLLTATLVFALIKNIWK